MRADFGAQHSTKEKKIEGKEQTPVHGELLNWAKIRYFFGF
jgi:hypothetical protein